MWAELVYYAYRLGQTWFAESSVHPTSLFSIDRDSLENKISCLLFKKTRRKKQEQESKRGVINATYTELSVLKVLNEREAAQG